MCTCAGAHTGRRGDRSTPAVYETRRKLNRCTRHRGKMLTEVDIRGPPLLHRPRPGRDAHECANRTTCTFLAHRPQGPGSRPRPRGRSASTAATQAPLRRNSRLGEARVRSKLRTSTSPATTPCRSKVPRIAPLPKAAPPPEGDVPACSAEAKRVGERDPTHPRTYGPQPTASRRERSSSASEEKDELPKSVSRSRPHRSAEDERSPRRPRRVMQHASASRNAMMGTAARAA